VSIIAIGVSAFIATNIDDIFVLMMFFSSSHSSSMAFPVRQIVLGQYMGIGLLITISALGSLISLVVPPYIIGLLGIVPIAVGAKRLIQIIIKGDKLTAPHSMDAAKESNSRRRNKQYLPFLAVAAVTFSNGGDNIGVYTPMFAQYNSVSQVTTLIVVFIAMTAVWCIAAYYLVNHPSVASRIRRIGHIVMPFVLIGLGVYILAQAFLVPSFLAVSPSDVLGMSLQVWH
jgi:cadmium resistance protein CadD (predicted permease)